MIFSGVTVKSNSSSTGPTTPSLSTRISQGVAVALFGLGVMVIFAMALGTCIFVFKFTEDSVGEDSIAGEPETHEIPLEEDMPEFGPAIENEYSA